MTPAPRRVTRPPLTSWRRWLLPEIAGRPGVAAIDLVETLTRLGHPEPRIVWGRVRALQRAGLVAHGPHRAPRSRGPGRPPVGLYLTAEGAALAATLDPGEVEPPGLSHEPGRLGDLAAGPPRGGSVDGDRDRIVAHVAAAPRRCLEGVNLIGWMRSEGWTAATVAHDLRALQRSGRLARRIDGLGRLVYEVPG